MISFDLRLKVVFTALVIASSIFIITPKMIPNAKATIFFSDDFEPSPSPGWAATGYWHLANDTTDPCIDAPGHPNGSYSPNQSYAYHIDASCDYDDGTQNFGYLMSPAIDLSGATKAYLHIKMWFQTQHGLISDTKYIRISTDGINWETLDQIADINGDPMSTWFSKEYNISTYAGDPDVYILCYFNTQDPAQNHFAGWYIDDIIIDDTSNAPDVLLVETWNRAPKKVDEDFGLVPMLQLNLTTCTNTITVTSIMIDFSGEPVNPSNIAWAELWQDLGNDIPEPSKDLLLDTQSPPFPIVFNVYLNISQPYPAHLFIVYYISSGTPGDWIGVSMTDNTFITVEDGDVVSPANFPVDTYTPGERTQIAATSTDILFVEGWNRGPSAVEPGQPPVPMLQLNLTASANVIRITSIDIGYSGTPFQQTNIHSAGIWLDSNSDDIFEPTKDAWLAGGNIPPCSYSITLWIDSEKNTKLFILYEIDIFAVVGDWVGVLMPDNSSIGIWGSDVVSATNFPIDTYDPGVRTQIVSPIADTLSVTYWQDNNPSIVEPGTSNVLMANMTLDASADSIRILSIDIDMKGTFTTVADVSAVKIFHDSNDNGLLDMDVDKLLSKGQFWDATPPTITMFLAGNGFIVSLGTPENLLIVYDISPAANIGDFIGIRLVDETYINLWPSSIDIVSSSNFPIETDPDTEIGVPTSDVLSVVHWQDNNPITAAPSASNILMTNMTLEVDANSVTIKSINIDLKGLPTVASDTSSVEIYHDVNDNGILEIGADVLLGFNAFSIGSPPTTSILLGAFGFTISNCTYENLLIVYDISPIASNGHFVGVSILDETYINLHDWSIDTVSSANFPIETSIDTEIVNIGHIAGQAIGEDGDPIEGATVTLTNSTGIIVDITTTDLNGDFTFSNMEGGMDEYNITVEKAYYQKAIIENIDVVAGTTTYVGTIVLQANATINGKVVDKDSNPISDVLSELIDDSSTTIDSTYTSGLGDFSFASVKYGKYAIRVSAMGYQTAITSQFTVDKNNLDITLPDIILTGIGNIMGKVIDENDDPLVDIKVTLYNLTNAEIGIVVTDANGNFTFSNIEEGVDEYSVVVTGEHYESATVSSIDVNVGLTTDMGTITLQTNATITGKILGSEGKGLANAKVELLDEDGNVTGTSYANSNGNYGFEGVGYGDYKIRVNAMGYQEYITSETYTVDKEHLDITISDIILNVIPDQFDLLWIIIVAVIAALILIIIFVMIRRKGRKPTESETELPLQERYNSENK